MRERRKILDLWQRGDPAVLVTLVRVEGSSYRRTGARMLIAANGDYAGSISGGCLEAELLRKAQWLTRSGAVLERYSTLFDDTADMPYGLGCGGTVELLLEPVDTPECHALIAAIEASLQGSAHGITTQLSGAAVVRTIRNAAGNSVFRSDLPIDKGQTSFSEDLKPPQRLFVFGAGDDAQPLVQMAALLGWSVLVIDGRAQWTRKDRFPEATKVLATASPGEIDALDIGPHDAAVVMTHSYEQDRAFLSALLPRSPRYLGLLGARHRSALLLSEAAGLLGWSVDRACQGLFSPVGLDLGGDGAESIALATIAEIQACCEGKLGVSRRMTPQIISEQIELGGASRYLQTLCAL